ncbi:MAG: hypothetical protein ABI585_16840 [Betaproteobacteria bacterium]
MSNRLWAHGALALALVATPAAAATDAELAEIREQIRALKANYESRIGALEHRLQDAERAMAPSDARSAALTEPVATVPPTEAPSTAAVSASASTRSSAFNPAISVVLQGRYADLSQDPDRYALAGFASGGEIGPGPRGFSLAESELTFSASVDHLFAANLTFALSPEDTVSVEEAFAVLTGLENGLAPKFGRFLSAIGYLNEQHRHVWDFVDAPLAYEAFLGGQYRNDGLQLKWVAPTDQFIELGAEIGRSDFFPGTATNRNGVGSAALYAHTGGDVGTSHSWRAGVSYLRTRAADRESLQPDRAGNEALTRYTGHSDVVIADFVWKYAPHGNARDTSVKVQGEYFWRRERGELAYDADGALGLTNSAPYDSRQSGWYLQGVYQFMPAWRVGARYDRLDPGTVDYTQNAPYLGGVDTRPQRTSVMVDWSPSEFSRLRLQLARAKTQADATDNQFFLQYILTLGAHGAHRF